MGGRGRPPDPERAAVRRRLLRLLRRVSGRTVYGWVERHMVGRHGPYYVYRWYDEGGEVRAFYLGRSREAREAYRRVRRAHRSKKRIARAIFRRALTSAYPWSVDAGIAAVLGFHRRRKREFLRLLRDLGLRW